jgi:arylsulfatase A-like enzyme
MTMSRSFVLALIALCGTTSVMHAAEPKRPNILFLFADDMRADSIGALGNPVVKTPHLDALAQRGMAFNNAYCLGGNTPAVCTPSRNMLLSGKAFFRWSGSFAPGDAPNFPLSMREVGYLTYHQGKRGNTAPLIQARFEINKYIDEDADRTSGDPGKQIADEAIEFLERGRDQRPFCMYLAFGNPHDPRVADRRYLDLYDRDKLPLPKNFLPVHPFDDGDMTIRDEQLSPWPRSEAEIRRHLHEYYAVVSAMDGHIGRILQSLKTLGLDENTIVIFSADQGIAIGSHGLLGKQSLYDAAMKSPLLIAGPGVVHGRSDALVYLLDIYPTVCDLIGISIPAGIDGVSFAPVLRGKALAARSELFLAYRNVQRAWRDERWKLIRYPQINRTQLFDLQQDPDEITDLSAEPTQASRIASMLAKLQAAQPRFGDTLALQSEHPQTAAWVPPTAEELKKLNKPAKKAMKK